MLKVLHHIVHNWLKVFLYLQLDIFFESLLFWYEVMDVKSVYISGRLGQGGCVVGSSGVLAGTAGVQTR